MSYIVTTQVLETLLQQGIVTVADAAARLALDPAITDQLVLEIDTGDLYRWHAEAWQNVGSVSGGGGAGPTDLSYDAATRILASSTGADATLPEVVAAGNSGLMTGTDKSKLDGIAAGAQVNVGTDLSYDPSTQRVTSSTGSYAYLTPAEPWSNAGLMGGVDKAKVDGIAYIDPPWGDVPTTVASNDPAFNIDLTAYSRWKILLDTDMTISSVSLEGGGNPYSYAWDVTFEITNPDDPSSMSEWLITFDSTFFLSNTAQAVPVSFRVFAGVTLVVVFTITNSGRFAVLKFPTIPYGGLAPEMIKPDEGYSEKTQLRYIPGDGKWEAVEINDVRTFEFDFYNADSSLKKVNLIPMDGTIIGIRKFDDSGTADGTITATVDGTALSGYDGVAVGDVSDIDDLAYPITAKTWFKITYEPDTVMEPFHLSFLWTPSFLAGAAPTAPSAWVASYYFSDTVSDVLSATAFTPFTVPGAGNGEQQGAATDYTTGAITAESTGPFVSIFTGNLSVSGLSGLLYVQVGEETNAPLLFCGDSLNPMLTHLSVSTDVATQTGFLGVSTADGPIFVGLGSHLSFSATENYASISASLDEFAPLTEFASARHELTPATEIHTYTNGTLNATDHNLVLPPTQETYLVGYTFSIIGNTNSNQKYTFELGTSGGPLTSKTAFSLHTQPHINSAGAPRHFTGGRVCLLENHDGSADGTDLRLYVRSSDIIDRFTLAGRTLWAMKIENAWASLSVAASDLNSTTTVPVSDNDVYNEPFGESFTDIRSSDNGVFDVTDLPGTIKIVSEKVCLVTAHYSFEESFSNVDARLETSSDGLNWEGIPGTSPFVAGFGSLATLGTFGAGLYVRLGFRTNNGNPSTLAIPYFEADLTVVELDVPNAGGGGGGGTGAWKSSFLYSMTVPDSDALPGYDTNFSPYGNITQHEDGDGVVDYTAGTITGVSGKGLTIQNLGGVYTNGEDLNVTLGDVELFSFTGLDNNTLLFSGVGDFTNTHAANFVWKLVGGSGFSHIYPNGGGTFSFNLTDSDNYIMVYSGTAFGGPTVNINSGGVVELDHAVAGYYSGGDLLLSGSRITLESAEATYLVGWGVTLEGPSSGGSRRIVMGLGYAINSYHPYEHDLIVEDDLNFANGSPHYYSGIGLHDNISAGFLGDMTLGAYWLDGGAGDLTVSNRNIWAYKVTTWVKNQYVSAAFPYSYTVTDTAAEPVTVINEGQFITSSTDVFDHGNPNPAVILIKEAMTIMVIGKLCAVETTFDFPPTTLAIQTSLDGVSWNTIWSTETIFAFLRTAHVMSMIDVPANTQVRMSIKCSDGMTQTLDVFNYLFAIVKIEAP